MGCKGFSGFADGRHEQSELVRIAKKLSKLEPKVQLRNFLSVEQIKDSEERAECEGLLQKERMFFEAKSVDTFNASDSRQPLTKRYLIVLFGRVLTAAIKKRANWLFFYYILSCLITLCCSIHLSSILRTLV